MYRKSLQEEKMGSLEVDEQPQFLNRVVQLPVVATAFDQLTSIYCRTKESNRLMKYTLQTAESGVMLATKTAQPVINRLETPSKCVLLCHLKLQLNLLNMIKMLIYLIIRLLNYKEFDTLCAYV